MPEYELNLLHCQPIDTAHAESFGLVHSHVAWDGRGLPELCVTIDSDSTKRPLANDNDLERLKLDLANATHGVYLHDKSSYILFNCSAVLGMYRNAFTNPTYFVIERAFGRLGLWDTVYVEHYVNPQTGIKSPPFTVYQKLIVNSYHGISLNGMPYHALSVDKQAAVKAHAHYLAKWGMWRAGELLDMPQDIERGSWIMMLQDDPIRSLDRLLVEDGIMRRNRLELGEWGFTARNLLFQFSRKNSTILSWNKLADVTVLGVDSAFLADVDVDAPNWSKIAVSVTTEGLLTTVEFSLKGVQ